MKTFYHKFCIEPFAMLPAAAAEWAARFSYEAPATAQQDDDRDFLGNTRPKMQWAGSVAIIPVMGPLIRGAGFLEKGFGAMAHEDISENIANALAENCSGIVLLVDSPGGTVRGTSELADEIYQARQQTNVVAFTGGMAASAAYWLASSASKVFATPTAEIGAVGAILQTMSISRLLDGAGIDVTTLTSKGSDVKAAGNPYKAMTDDERATLQRGVDTAGAMFKAAVSRNRPFHGGTQDGAMLFASDAKAAGLIDEIMPNLNAVVDAMQQEPPQRQPAYPNQPKTLPKDQGKDREDDPNDGHDEDMPRKRVSVLASADAAFRRAVARGQVPQFKTESRTFATSQFQTRLPAPVSAATAGTLEEQWQKMSARERGEFGGSFKTFSAFKRHGGDAMAAKSARRSHYASSAAFRK